MKHNERAAFHWDTGEPSIFASDPHFRAASTTGKSLSATASDAVSRHVAATGRSPGSINGLSNRGDDLIEQGLARRIAGGRA